MRGIKSLVLLQLVYLTTCMDQLHIRYQWNLLDFQFPTPEDRLDAIDNGTFIPENNVPMGLEVWGDRLFITVLRWKSGVPSSLNYINLNDSSESPKLIPYPSWAEHYSDSTGLREINAPYRMRIDRCGRLWVMDNGKVGRGDNSIVYPPAFVIIDLNTDKILRKYVIPEDQVDDNPGLGNIAIEDTDCEDTYAYAADYRQKALIVYSWAKGESFMIKHEYFNVDPIATQFSNNGWDYSWKDGILGVAISGPNPDGFRTLYFHPMTSFNEFSVSTEYLRNKSIADGNHDAFKLLGSRGHQTQSLSSFVHQKTGVLFYNLVTQNAVGCWRTSNEVFDETNQGTIDKNNETLAMPVDLKVDYNDNLWVMSNKFYLYMYSQYDPCVVNFRILTAPVVDAIRGTICDVPEKDKQKTCAYKEKNSSPVLGPDAA